MCVNLQNILENALFSGKIYTSDKKIYTTAVASAVTIINELLEVGVIVGSLIYRGLTKDSMLLFSCPSSSIPTLMSE